MRTRTTTAITTALLLAVLTACGGGSGEPETAASSSPTPSRQYDVHDCKALLERNYEADKLRDASSDPECAHLTKDEYGSAVGEVLTGHKDDILEQSADEIAWDAAWDRTDVEQQLVVCERLADDGAIVVGQEMMDAADEPAGTEIDMVQYFLEEKC
ncbi:hypothetical protein ACFVWX_29035 [Streptomyces sp. NPDC058220]|uniref:hypothetical protein n=1 Tax=Streptomyces sp. NPDC058220 TaxID=3346387 RepID=UPI0036E3219B